MDPDANLKEQLELVEKMRLAYDETDDNGIDQDDANRLAVLVIALDNWISNKGFLPAKWRVVECVSHEVDHERGFTREGSGTYGCYCSVCGRHGEFRFEFQAAEIEWEED